MPRLASTIAIIGWLLGGLACAQAGVVVTVDKTAQRLSVSVDGMPRYQWPVSTARMGYHTPNGSYRPERLARTWFSSKYDWSPMPYSIFFHGGYAIHGSYDVSRLGRPASHGCIRLHPANAAVLFALVKAHQGQTRHWR
jgi:lipoprotein-anchoring transpeptidase ErfK/SrfK